jgi:hypothetical protein
VEAAAEVLKQNLHLLTLAPASVEGHD